MSHKHRQTWNVLDRPVGICPLSGFYFRVCLHDDDSETRPPSPVSQNPAPSRCLGPAGEVGGWPRREDPSPGSCGSVPPASQAQAPAVRDATGPSHARLPGPAWTSRGLVSSLGRS